MEAIATQRFIRMSPRKLRLVADMVRELTPSQAIETLPLVRKRAALPLTKVVRTAIANATVKGADPEVLVFKEIQINEGPPMKRGLPVSRGRWHPILKRTSHIRVVVTTEGKKKNSMVSTKDAKQAASTGKSQMKAKDKNSKVKKENTKTGKEKNKA